MNFQAGRMRANRDLSVPLKLGFVLDVRAICNVKLMLKTLVQLYNVPIFLRALLLTAMAISLSPKSILHRSTIGFVIFRVAAPPLPFPPRARQELTPNAGFAENRANGAKSRLAVSFSRIILRDGSRA